MENPQPTVSVGEIMRFWRDRRSVSQLDLGLEANVSQRHISFVESGRSVPSRKLLISISDALNIPFRERNLLLLAVGYAPVYREPALDDAPMEFLNVAIETMLRNHEPHPAFLLDRYWNVLRTNAAAPTFFNLFVDLESWPRPRNLLELMFDPKGLRPFVENWKEFAAGLLLRVRREAVGQVYDSRLKDLLHKLRSYPGTAELTPLVPSESPILPVIFRKGDLRVAYFSLITTVGTPQSVTAEELRLDCLFPVDPPPQAMLHNTRRAFRVTRPTQKITTTCSRGTRHT